MDIYLYDSFREVAAMKKCLLFLLVIILVSSVSALADSDMKVVAFSDAGLEKEVDGVSFADGVLTVASPGEYMLSGELTNGQLSVDCAEDGKVTLYLNGVTIHTDGAAAILIGECKPKVVLSLVSGTENTVSNGAQAAPDEDEEPNGVIFSQSDLVIEGSGSLKVTAASADGIVSKDELEIRGGKITVDAKRHGIKGKDCVEIYDGEITVTAGRDGIKSTNKKDSSRGYVSIRGGIVTILCGDEPIQFVTGCTVENAKISLGMNKEK